MQWGVSRVALWERCWADLGLGEAWPGVTWSLTPHGSEGEALRVGVGRRLLANIYQDL